MTANVDEYLAHIGYTGSKEPTIANLGALHSCHLFSIVFENMSCIIGEKVQLDQDWIFEKIVKRGRGGKVLHYSMESNFLVWGFCFELNGIFHWLLKSLGYDVRMVSAAVSSLNSGVFCCICLQTGCKLNCQKIYTRLQHQGFPLDSPFPPITWWTWSRLRINFWGGGMVVNNIPPTTLSRLRVGSSSVMWDLASTLSPPQYPWRWQFFRRKTVWSKISH